MSDAVVGLLIQCACGAAFGGLMYGLKKWRDRRRGK